MFCLVQQLGDTVDGRDPTWIPFNFMINVYGIYNIYGKCIYLKHTINTVDG